MTSPSRKKWITIESPSQPADEVVREVLEHRFATVAHYFPLAAEAWRDDIEYVHQLRVGCRRASATVSAMAEFLPAKASKRALKWLKRIRNAAGDARDDDVILSRLSEAAASSHPELAPLIERIEKHREKSQRPILLMRERAEKRSALKKLGETPSLVRWEGDGDVPSYADLARRQLSSVAATFFEVSNEGLKSSDGLHDLRIVGKQLRYSMELFSDVYGDDFREKIYPVVEELQEHLGSVNDHATAQARYQFWVSCLPPDEAAAYVAHMIEREWKAFNKERDRFLEWWTPERAGEFQEALETEINESVES